MAQHLRDDVVRVHQLGLAHCDLHEENVCVAFQGDKVKVTIIDFGLAKFLSQEEGDLAMMDNRFLVDQDWEMVGDIISLLES